MKDHRIKMAAKIIIIMMIIYCQKSMKYGEYFFQASFTAIQ